MFEPKTREVGSRERVTYSCSACSACCRNVRDSVMLAPYDAFRLVQHFMQDDSEQLPDSILSEYAQLKPLTRGYDVYVLNTIKDSGVCTFLVNGRCAVYKARPRTCRLYPFSAEPTKDGNSIKWELCTEQPHHFKKGNITAREWQRRNMPKEEKEIFLTEARVLPQLGKLMRNISDERMHEAETFTLLFLYYAYDYDNAFLPQYKDNMLFLKAKLESLGENM